MRNLIFLCLIFLSISLCSCSNYILKTNTATRAGVNGQTSIEVNKQIYFWGVYQSRAIHNDTEEQCDGPVSEVIVKKNFGQGLISLISFGIVDLATIEYSCAQD